MKTPYGRRHRRELKLLREKFGTESVSMAATEAIDMYSYTVDTGKCVFQIETNEFPLNMPVIIIVKYKTTVLNVRIFLDPDSFDISRHLSDYIEGIQARTLRPPEDPKPIHSSFRAGSRL